MLQGQRAYKAPRATKTSPEALAKRRAYQQTPAGQAAAKRAYEKTRNNPEKLRLISQRAMVHQQVRRDWLAELKLWLGCKDCGYREHHAALDFDHVKGVKRFAISTAYVPLPRLLEELDKCECVCSNCHRIRTYNRSH